MPAVPLIVFDVNETLLDFGTLEPTFERIFGNKNDMRLWFANLVMYSLALTLAGLLRSVHGYRFGGHADAGRRTGHQDR